MNTNTNAAPDLRDQIMDVITGVWDRETQIGDAADAVIDLCALSTAAQPPAGYVLVPVEPTPEMLVRGGEEFFDSARNRDIGSTLNDQDHAAMIYQGMLAAAPKAEPQVKADTAPLNSADAEVKAEPVQQPERVPLPNAEFVAAIEASGFTTWDSRMWELKRHLEAAHGIQPAHKEQP